MLLYKEFFMATDISWADVMIKFSYLLSGVSLVLLPLSLLFFNRKMRIKKPVTKEIENFQTLNQLT